MRENTFITIFSTRTKSLRKRNGQCEETKKPRYTRCISISCRYCKYNLEIYCRHKYIVDISCRYVGVQRDITYASHIHIDTHLFDVHQIFRE